MTGILVVGSGDHARVVADLVRAGGDAVLGFLGPRSAGRDAGGTGALLGDLEVDLNWREAHAGASFVVAIGANDVRLRAFERCLELGLLPIAVRHPTAVLLGGAFLAEGAQLCAQALVGVDARVGRNVIVNTAASLDHDVDVADHAFVGPGARLAGRVRVGEAAHVGLGAVVREGTIIGAGALVAAGAVVIADVDPGIHVAGVPAVQMQDRRKP